MAKEDKLSKPTFLDSLVGFDVVRLFWDWLESGAWYICPETGKIRLRKHMIDPNRHWIYTNPNPNLHCGFYMDGVFNHLNFVHSKCMECWKVVVKMQNVVQLFQIYEWQKDFTNDCKGKDRFCKCGIEKRSYTNYNYGAYFYNRGIEQGKLRHGQVYAAMQDLFGKENVSDKPGSVNDGMVEVILKRYCTEFELKFGPTNKYVRPAAADAMEAELDQAFLLEKFCPGQPPFLIKHIQFKWLEHAWMRGDRTAKAFNGNEAFYTPVVTYHDQKEDKNAQ